MMETMSFAIIFLFGNRGPIGKSFLKYYGLAPIPFLLSRSEKLHMEPSPVFQPPRPAGFPSPRGNFLSDK